MARDLTPRDAHALMNELVKQATGQKTIAVVDSSTFVSAGEMVLATGTENVLNALGLVLGRTFMGVRPYKAPLRLINAISTKAFTTRMRKISFYAKEAQASGDYNTQLFTNLAMGFDNGENPAGTPPVAQSTMSQWEQNQPVPLEMNFAGSSTWEDSITVYDTQLKIAFRSEDEFLKFVSGYMTEKGNDIESQKEAFNRMTLLNHMAGVYDLAAYGCEAVDLTAAFNAKFGTSYTRTQLLTTYFEDFLKFFVAEFKGYSDKMKNRSKKWHWSPDKTVNGVSYSLLRHTPKDKQRAIMYAPFFRDAESYVMPQIFNPEYLKIDNFETVEYWQAESGGSGINVTPAIPDADSTSPTYGTQIAGTPVALDYVLGVLYDEDALMVDYQLEASESTVKEARKRYRNIWWTFSKNAINDFTENFVLFYLGQFFARKMRGCGFYTATA